MANLIITIIAIALTAILAIAGAWYGSSAFMEGQAKGRVNKIVSDFKQVDAAIKVWMAENAGAWPNPRTDTPVNGAAAGWFTRTELASFLVPNYIQESGLNVSFLYQLAAMTNPVLLNNDATSSANGGLMGTLTEQVCKQVEAIRTGITPATLRDCVATDFNSNINNAFCGSFGCFRDTSVPGACGFGGDYVVYFRLAGPPVPASPDCTINP